ncbi:MAG: thioredoxin family protein [Proteobacteria bacterium]|nr:thioredoxin family protein [Pseudomonadota bacterium]
MKKFALLAAVFIFIFGCGPSQDPPASPARSGRTDALPNQTVLPPEVPVKGLVTMVDLGADKCVPCKMMAPVLIELEKEFRGRAAIVFLDVWKDRTPAKRFGIKAIPTQIFFDASGREVYRHVGFMDKDAIAAQLKEMGIE